MKAFVYILKSKYYSKTYTGVTKNISKRLNEHNRGCNSYTKKYMPWEIIHREEFDNMETARRREKYFKSGAGRRFIKNKLFEN